MFRSLFGLPPKKEPALQEAITDRFTLKHLQSLHATLVRLRSTVNASDDHIVDVIKQISELMVYGDKNDEKFFEYAVIRERQPSLPTRQRFLHPSQVFL